VQLVGGRLELMREINDICFHFGGRGQKYEI
jgi:hypothetical protein